jgi:hypothetical protein
MEVHHHPDLHHKKKNFKEYFLEFLMIFLAVIMGFIAENIREHLSQRSKEKEYVASIIKDVNTDSSNLHYMIYTYFPKLNKWVDSSVNMLDSPQTRYNDRLVYQAVENATLWRHFYSNQRTLTQLKNSGNFILISNQEAVKEILNYDNRISTFTPLNNNLTVYEHDVDTTQLRFTDYRIVRNLFKEQSSKAFDFLTINDIPTDARLKNFNDENRVIFANKLKQMNVEDNIMLGQYEALYNESVNLIHLLKKEYKQ